VRCCDQALPLIYAAYRSHNQNLLTTEDTKEHEGKPTPKLTAEDAKVANERRGKQLGKNLRKKRRNLKLVIRRNTEKTKSKPSYR